MGKYLDIARKLEKQKAESLGSPGEHLKSVTPEPVERGGLDFIDRLTETELEYYLNLLEIMQSEKFGLDRGAAEAEAWEIVDEYRSRKKKRLELPSQQRGDGKAIAESFYGKKGNGKTKTSSSTERLHPK